MSPLNFNEQQEYGIMDSAASDEQFLPVPGFPRYEVSNYGRVRSNYVHGVRRTSDRVGPWKYRSPSLSGTKRWLKVDLNQGGVRRAFSIGQLVLIAFVGECPPGQECRHLDGNIYNNHVSNLKWGTPLENSDDKRRHGTIRYGKNHGMAKLNEAQVIEIRRRRASGETARSLAKEFGVSEAAISSACLGIRWTHLPVDPSLPKPPRVKLREVQVREIRRRIAAGERQSRLAAEFGLSTATVSNINLRRTWADLS